MRGTHWQVRSSTGFPAAPEPQRRIERRRQEAQPFRRDPLCGSRAELRPADAANHQNQRKHAIDEVVGGGV
jgi:hypothetical protein